MQVWYQSQQSHTSAVSRSSADCQLRAELEEQKKKGQVQREALQRAYLRNKNIKKRLARQQQKKKTTNAAIQSLQASLSDSKKRLATAVTAKSAVTRTKNLLQGKCTRLTIGNAKLAAQAKTAGSKLKKAEEEITRLRSCLADSYKKQQPGNITTMAGSPPQYTDAVRHTCIKLLSHDVGVEHVSAIIRTVIHTVTPLYIDRLPSPAKMCVFLGEAKQLFLSQIGEELLSSTNLTLHRDCTTKQGEKYYGAQVATNDSMLNIGLSYVKSGTAEHCFDAVIDVIKDIATAMESAGTDKAVFDTILANITNTMSDRGSVEKACNTLLTNYRAKLLPRIVSNWADRSAADRTKLEAMDNFFCGLHYVVGLAEQSQETLRTWEKAQFGENRAGATAPSGELGPIRMIRTVCKALEAHCNEQCGNHVQFKSYLHSIGIQSLPLARFVGNRFNIIFYNAGGVYFLREHIIKFYDKVFGTPNRLHAAVRLDVGVPEFLAACRALGIIGKLITGPLWRHLATPTTHIADMSSIYTALVSNFEKWSSAPQDLLDGSAVAFRDAQVTLDDVHHELFTPSEHDDLTTVILQLICASFAKFSRRLLADHLPGGSLPTTCQEASIMSSVTVNLVTVLPQQMSSANGHSPNLTE